jgi:hypothetical protein
MVVNLKLPVGTADPVQRLRMIDAQLGKLKGSLAPVLLFYLTPLLGGLFHWILRIVCKDVVNTSIGTSFPGPTAQHFISGLPISDIMLLTSLPKGHVGKALIGHSKYEALCTKLFAILRQISVMIDEI